MPPDIFIPDDKTFDGRHLAEVMSATSGHAKKSDDAYLRLTFKDVETGEELCQDIVMLEGSARGIGLSKLKALGAKSKRAPNGKGTIVNTDTLRGLRCYLTVRTGQYNGSARTEVDGKAENTRFGYEPVDSAGATAPTPEPPVVPF
jgi:hypothetical protein